MADEYAKPPYNRKSGIPFDYDWQSLRTKRGTDLEAHYLATLRELGQKKGLLGQIFTKAQDAVDLLKNARRHKATNHNPDIKGKNGHWG